MDNIIYQILENHISRLKANNIYRNFTPINRIRSLTPICNYKDNQIINWSSNDYLSLSKNKEILSSFIESLEKHGTGAGGTRNISGTSDSIIELEKTISSLHDKESALLFSSGYVANDASISTLVKLIDNLHIFSDADNHASLISGMIRYKDKCKKFIFNHNDMDDLENKLKQVDISYNKLIVVEGVYSMNGNICKIDKLMQLAKKYKALTYVDEVHAVGLYGSKGGGICQLYNVSDEVDIIQATFGKAFALKGGYIAGSQIIIDCIRSFAPGFIFTTATSAAQADAITTSVNIIKNNPEIRKKYQEQVKLFKQILKNHEINILENDSQIVIIPIGNEAKCKQLSKTLLSNHNMYLTPIFYPTVPKNKSILRVIVTLNHNEEQMYNLAHTLKLYL